MIEWDSTTERYFQHGVDRGVLYPSVGDPVAWNGITGVDESGNGASTMLYLDGKVYMADVDASDFEGKLSAYFFPDEFAVCIGMPEITDGLVVDNQKPKRFGLSYRSLIGSGSDGDMFGYQIHLIYKAMASIGGRSRKSLNKTPTPIEFSFDIVATPIRLPGYRPSAHYIIDTRRLDPETVNELERILYGSGDIPGRLPEPIELYEMLNFGNNLEVLVYAGNTMWAEPKADRGLNGAYNIKGSRVNVVDNLNGTYTINNIDAVDNGDGTYTISDGPTTTVTVE